MKSKQQELDVCEHMVISRKHTLLQANQSRNPNGWIFVLLSPQRTRRANLEQKVQFSVENTKIQHPPSKVNINVVR